MVLGVAMCYADRTNMDEYTIEPDSSVDFATEVQQALDSGRPVHIQSGTYVVLKPLSLPSGARIIADSGATILLGDAVCKTATDYLLSNADPDAGNTDIHVSGGIWDGNNRGNPRPEGGLFAEGYTGAMFHFENVKGLHVESLCMRNAEAYHLRITGVTQFHIEGLSFASDRVRPNNDGVHLGGNCSDGLIRDIRGLCFGVTNDDLVALNADDGLNRTEVRGMQAGPIQRVLIEHLRADGVHCFIRLLSVFSPIEDIHIEDIKGTTRNTVINCDGCRRCRVQLFDPDAPPFANGIGTLRNITIRSLRVGPAGAGEHTEATEGDPLPLFRLESRCSNVLFEDVTRTDAHGQALREPTFAVAYLPGTRTTVDGIGKTLEPDETYRSWAERIDRMTIDTPDL